MAYKQSPRGQFNKTGHGLPRAFNQAPTHQEKGFVDSVKKMASDAWEGFKKFDKGLEGKSDTRSFNESDTAFGRHTYGSKAGTKHEENPKTGKKTNSPAGKKPNPPAKQTKKPVKKEEGFVETVKKVANDAWEGFKKFDKGLEGDSDTRSFNKKDTAFGRISTGAQAGKKANPKSGK